MLLATNAGPVNIIQRDYIGARSDAVGGGTAIQSREVAIASFIFGRASDLYLCVYNQLFALFHYVFRFLTY
jgi:hypothetical protein